MSNRIICKNCGVVLGPVCIKCLVEKHIEEDLASRLPKEVFIKEGDGPTDEDPSPLEIKFRMAIERRKREARLARREKRKYRRKRTWENDPRIVRIFKEPKV